MKHYQFNNHPFKGPGAPKILDTGSSQPLFNRSRPSPNPTPGPGPSTSSTGQGALSRAAAAIITAILALALGLAGCNPGSSLFSWGKGGDHHDHHHDHHHGEHGADLDKTLEELLDQSCEHQIKAHQCEDCSYEVGAVTVSPELFNGGIMETWKVGTMAQSRTLTLDARLDFNKLKSAQVTSPTEGTVTKILVDQGETVARGQPLLELNSTELAEGWSSYLKALGTGELVRTNLERQELLKKEGITSGREHLEARQAMELATIEIRAAREKLSRLGVSKSQLGRAPKSPPADLGKLVISAPIPGVILDINTSPGQVVGRSEPLMETANLSTLWVWASLHEQNLAEVLERFRENNGRLRATITTDAFKDEEFEGTVDFISPAVSSETRTIKVRISVDNRDNLLHPGMYGQAVFHLDSPGPNGPDRQLHHQGEGGLEGRNQVIAVPQEAVLKDENREFVFKRINHSDLFIRRPVVSGLPLAQAMVEIKEGLTAGEEIVTKGAFVLKSDVLRAKMGAGCAD